MAITGDRVETLDFVPFALTSPDRVPKERYRDRGFFELEKEKLWPYVWQVACREEEVPSPGDYIEYQICDQSILIVRQRDGSVKAFENACRHRATELAAGSGRFGGGQISCPFHGWRWDIDGSNSLVFGPEEAPRDCADPEYLRLRECQAGTWGGQVWINMDRNAQPLFEALSPAAAMLEAGGVGLMRGYYMREVILDANWKIAIESFGEGAHSWRLHPQMVNEVQGEDWRPNTINTTYENGHFRLAGARHLESLSADEFVHINRQLFEGQDAMVLEREVRFLEELAGNVGPDEDFPSAAVNAYFDLLDATGVPNRGVESAAYWGSDIHLFPNFAMVPQWANSIAYWARPYGDDPEKCRLQVWSLTSYPAGAEPTEPPKVERFDKDDDEHFGLILRQHFAAIERQQRGLRTRSFDSMRIYPEWEKMIPNAHAEIDRYLAR